MRGGLRLDFAKRTPSERKAGIAALILAGITAAYLVGAYVNRVTERDALEVEWRVLQEKRGARYPGRLSAEAVARLKSQIDHANRTAERLALPWEAFFSGLEASVTPEVALLGVEPDIPARTVQILAEAKDYAAMLAYVRKLAEQPLFADPYIVSHEIQVSDPQRPIRFSVAMRGVFPGEGKPTPEREP